MPYMSICIQSSMNLYSTKFALPFCLIGCLSIGGCLLLTNTLKLTNHQVVFINRWLKNYEGNAWSSIHRRIYASKSKRKKRTERSILFISQPVYSQYPLKLCNQWYSYQILRIKRSYQQVLLTQLNTLLQGWLLKSKILKSTLQLIISVISFLFGHFLFAVFPFQLARLIQPKLASYNKCISSSMMTLIIAFSFVTPFFFSIIMAHIITTTALILPYIKFFLPYFAIIIVIIYFIYYQLSTYFNDRLTTVKILHEIRDELQTDLLYDSNFFTAVNLKVDICDTLPKTNYMQLPKSLSNLMIQLVNEVVGFPKLLHSSMRLDKHVSFYMRLRLANETVNVETFDVNLDILCYLKSIEVDDFAVRSNYICMPKHINRFMKVALSDFYTKKEIEDYIMSWLAFAYYDLAYGIVAIPVKLYQRIVQLYPGYYYNIAHLILHILLLIMISATYFSSIIIFDNLRGIDSYMESATTFLVTYVSIFAGVQCGNGIQLNEYQLRKAFKIQVIKYIACKMNCKKF